jgi:hypothetical protein
MSDPALPDSHAAVRAAPALTPGTMDRAPLTATADGVGGVAHVPRRDGSAARLGPPAASPADGTRSQHRPRGWVPAQHDRMWDQTSTAHEQPPTGSFFPWSKRGNSGQTVQGASADSSPRAPCTFANRSRRPCARGKWHAIPDVRDTPAGTRRTTAWPPRRRGAPQAVSDVTPLPG